MKDGGAFEVKVGPMFRKNFPENISARPIRRAWLFRESP
jgi:hypothetical protein